MKVFCLGGAGKIAREAIADLVEHSAFSTITIGDFNQEEAEKTAEWLNDPRIDVQFVDVRAHDQTVKQLKGYDVVMDGTTITLNGLSTQCIADAGCHGVNLNGFGEENKAHETFKEHGKAFIAGFGMTPGVTQMMAMAAAQKLDTVESVRVSHGSFRPIAFSKSITETTTYEYDPNLEDRVVYENGSFTVVPPFARPRKIHLPEPYGTTTQYIIPHAETKTLAQALADKQVQLIEVRGTWPEENMNLIKSLYNFGFIRNDAIEVNGQSIGIMDCISEHLGHSIEGQTTSLYGYALHVEVIGEVNHQRIQHILTHTHPRSDGTVPGWEFLRAYTRNVGIPMAVAAELLAQHHVNANGVVIPEDAFEPQLIFSELEKRDIYIHEEITKPAE
ncbi:saccharopine dehydrogenase family protein [Salibacterium halotolerans]|uniref:Saccharopine dehydrogenase, NADP-dependent n=1 Tax=Salibacterium halotolerans TaxID=1884432 RepID=A0A1I5W073_9BACI|nr:saccharopine dehydrogenase C-terminal domain-containing protein [Salibacterium halotolerans]SFQ13091.1 Saccharopine dehydrogenase, NADP-dependent [Salibacterium halotolerans]